MNNSHTPEGTRCRIGCTRPSQRLKSAMTLTRCALGAHGEVNAGDATDRHDVRAELLPRAQVRPLAEQMEVVVREDLTELIGIGDLARASVFMRAESICEIRRAS